MATIEEILNHRNLTGVIKSVKSGIPNPLPPAFFNVGRRFSGNKAEYFRITGTRQTARLPHYGSPAQRRDLRGLDNVPVTLLHTFESQQWPMHIMVNLTKMGGTDQDGKGQEQAEYQTGEFKRLFANLRIAAAVMVLFGGIIYVDKSGNLLPTSSGSSYSIQFGMQSANQGQLGGTISTTWANTAATIITQLVNLRTKARKLTGYPIEYAFYGDSIAELIASNATAQQYLKLNPQMNAEFIGSGMVPQGFGGIKNWIYAGDSFYADSSNTNQTLLGAGQIIFTPAPSPDWWDIFEGSYLVPTTINPQIGGDSTTLLKNIAEEYGMFQYAQMTMNPPSIEQFAGDTFLPVLKVPNAIWQATVVF